MKKLVWLMMSVVGASLLCGGTDAGADDVQKVAFPNGFRLLVKPEPGKGLVALTMIVRAGALEEEDTPGMGQLLTRTLLTTARNLSARKLAQLSDEVGGSFSITWDLDYTEVYISTTSDQMGAAVELLAETLISPKFDDSVLGSAKTDIAGEIKSGKEAAFRSSYDEVRRLLYAGSPYKRPLLGLEKSIESISAGDLSAYCAQWFVPSNMVLAVVGDVSSQSTQDAVKLWFGRQKATAPPGRRSVPTEAGPEAAPSILEMESKASYVVAGTLASGVGSANFPADAVVSTVLGGGKASRMFQELREGQGLAYELGAIYPSLVYQSHVVAYLLAAPYSVEPGAREAAPTLETLRDALKKTIQSLRDRPITEAELERAKRYVIGNFALQHERLQQRAKQLAWFEAMGIGFAADNLFREKVNAVTLAAARESANRLFSRSAMVVVLPRE